MYTAEIISSQEQGDVLPNMVVTVQYSKDEYVIHPENLNPYARATKMILSL